MTGSENAGASLADSLRQVNFRRAPARLYSAMAIFYNPHAFLGTPR